MKYKIPTRYYEQFDADYSLDVPAEGYNGWQKKDLPISPENTALVIMHAWDTGKYEDYPGWYKVVEFFSRSEKIMDEVFPPLVKAVRGQDKIKLFHVVIPGKYYQHYEGYKKALKLAGEEPPKLDNIAGGGVYDILKDFKGNIGEHNGPDIKRGFENLDIPDVVKPVCEEGVAENSHQLFALCKEYKINHLIYTGFAINWCLFLSGGGMVDMHKRGFICSAVPEAVTAVENKGTAREEICKKIALWRVAYQFGFLYDMEDLLKLLESLTRNN